MLKFSDAATLALHAIFIIAAESGRSLSAASLAQYLNVSEAHLSKVLQRLAKLGLIESRRGPHGGFSLGKRPEAITLLDVYEAIDGPVRQNTCLLGRDDCPMHGCIMGDLVASLSHQLRSFLQQTSLAALMKEPGAFIPERPNNSGEEAKRPIDEKSKPGGEDSLRRQPEGCVPGMARDKSDLASETAAPGEDATSKRPRKTTRRQTKEAGKTS